METIPLYHLGHQVQSYIDLKHFRIQALNSVKFLSYGLYYLTDAFHSGSNITVVKDNHTTSEKAAEL